MKTAIPEADLLDLLDKEIPPGRIAALYRVPEAQVARQIAGIEREKERRAAAIATRLRAAMGGRPAPPGALLETPGLFAPAPDLLDWARATFLSGDGPLYNPEHDHLDCASLGFLWTSAPYRKQGRAVAGLAEMPSVQGNAWVRGRMAQQLAQWFGEEPAFLITLHAETAAGLDDASFCALCEHEILHCGQASDEFGGPKFNKEGFPVLAIKGHDAEEHVSIVRRYGVGAAAAGVAELVAAASRPPSVAAANIAHACGTCLR